MLCPLKFTITNKDFLKTIFKQDGRKGLERIYECEKKDCAWWVENIIDKPDKELPETLRELDKNGEPIKIDDGKCAIKLISEAK